VLYQIDYVWRLDNTLDTRIEFDATTQESATVEFEYDNRDRLTRETRTVNSTQVYDIEYDYDQLGNRTVKIENVADRITYYEYDTDYEDPYELEYPTRNNRLLKYEVYENDVLTRTVSYVYYKTGDVSNITIKDEDDPWYRDVMFTYYGTGEVAFVLWDRWQQDSQNYERVALREFGYHAPRARFMSRERDPQSWDAQEPMLWTDYDTVVSYGDAEVTAEPGSGDALVDELTRYLDAFGAQAQQTVTTGEMRYVHDDLIGSTAMLTDQTGATAGTLAYSAFGEPVGDAQALGTRYRYAGAWGYQSDLIILEGAPGTAPITLLHVGARWYQPEIGRFVQRDPIGIWGGPNVYVYVGNNPLGSVDPSGLLWGENQDDWLNNWFAGLWRKALGDKRLVKMSDTGVILTATGVSVGVTALGTGGWIFIAGKGWVQVGWTGATWVVRAAGSEKVLPWVAVMGGRAIGWPHWPWLRLPWIPARYPFAPYGGAPGSNCFWGMLCALWQAT
jgi:RHS repeat-associated protein